MKNSSGIIRRFRKWGAIRRTSLVADSTIRVFKVGVLLAVSFGLVSVLWIQHYETKRLTGQVEDLLSTVESAVKVACFARDVTLARDVARGLLTNRLVAAVKIKAGDVVLADELSDQQDATHPAETYVVKRWVSSPFGPDETVGEIELMADNALIRSQAAGYSLVSGIVLLLEVIAVAWAVALVMMRTVVRPIKEFSSRIHAVQIHAGEHVVAPDGNACNEIGLLANDFNQMIDDVNILLAAEQLMREEIELNEQRFRTLVENSPDIIARHDKDCRWVFVNPAFSRETGLKLEQFLYKDVEDLSVWLPSMAAADYRQRLKQVMVSGKPDHILLEWTRPDGCPVSHEMYVVAEYDVGGHVSGVLAIGRDISKRKEAERLLLHQASYDALTGLPNRRLFGDRLHDEIAKADRGGYSLALLFVDLDRFKEVNDTMGHAVGDQLLVETAKRIRYCVRETDTVARLAGDEFVVILPDIDESYPLDRIAQSIVGVTAQPFHFGSHGASVSASIGIALYPQDAENAETLIGCADQAMYAAKKEGRNSFSFFNRGMLEQTQQRLRMANDLREAIDRGQLEVHYQPIVEVASGRPLKAEALLRWRHPGLGMVSPELFIPIAEETGLIQEIGAWVFKQAVDLAKYWNTQMGMTGGRQISINMSPRQFTKGNGDEIAIQCLLEAGLSSAHVVVEITEGLLLDDCPVVNEQLARLRAAGIAISLDDFGTGYSAMAYLKKFNIDYLKIDRSFVRDLETNSGDRAIAEAIVVMSHRLGLKVIAEGVETEGQRALLAAVGCEYVQGYLFAKPMPAAAFLDYVAEHQ